MVSYSADSHTLYGDLVHYPSKAWGKGLMLEVTEWDTGKPLGFIPQAAVTYNVIGEHERAPGGHHREYLGGTQGAL